MAILTSKLPDWKTKKVNELAEAMKSSKTVGLIDIKSLPAQEIHGLRSKLRDKMSIEVIKKSVLLFAIEKIKNEVQGIDTLSEKIGAMPALVLSSLDPFRMSMLFMSNKAAASAKAGDIAPEDITISAGPTPFAPGPMLADLKSKGLKVKVEAGKIVVQEDSVLVHKGKEISADVADLLVKLGIKPMEVGFELSGAFDGKDVFGKDVLLFDAKAFMNDLSTAASDAFKLSIGLPYPTKENISLLVGKAYNEAKTLAKERDIFVDVLAGELLAKASAQAGELNTFVESKTPQQS